jgi:hypothetical protein
VCVLLPCRDLPQATQDAYGGFIDSRIIEDFAYFAGRLAWMLLPPSAAVPLLKAALLAGVAAALRSMHQACT